MVTEKLNLQIAGYDVHGVCFLPEGEVVATALLIHGQGDFVMRYQEVAEAFCSYGVAVVGVDLPGHGHTSGRLGDIPSLSVADQFLSAVREYCETRYPDVPRGIAGHSMGGLLGLRELLIGDSYYSFCWLSSPLLQPARNKPALEIQVLKQLVKILPKMTISTGAKRDLCRRVQSDLCVEHKSNPLFHNRISLRWGYELIETAARIMSLADSHSVRTPTLMTQGDQDKVTPLLYAEQFVTGYGWDSLELAVIENALHEPFRDISKQECLSLIRSWLESEIMPILSDNSSDGGD